MEGYQIREIPFIYFSRNNSFDRVFIFVWLINKTI